MKFSDAHREYVAFHESRRRGERLRRLREGHMHAERLFLKQVWWPAFQTFRHLHPEYEVLDFDGRRRFIDFAYLRDDTKLAIEIDGFGPHASELSRWEFMRNLRRQNHLILDGWSVLRFSYDDIKDHPRQCQQVLQQFMGRQSWGNEMAGLTFRERSVLQLALRTGRPLTPRDVCRHLGIGRQLAYQILRSLLHQGWLEPASGRQRIRSYRLPPSRLLG